MLPEQEVNCMYFSYKLFHELNFLDMLAVKSV